MLLQQFFDDLAADFIRCADMIAERATALDGGTEGTVPMGTANSRIEELLTELSDEQSFVSAMAERFAQYAASLPSAMDESAHWNDATTSDLFTETSREVDKSLCFIEPHLQT